MMTDLTPDAFPRLAAAVTRWLLQLAGTPDLQPRSEWWSRVVQEPFETFKQQFGAVIGDTVMRWAHERLSQLLSLPMVFEHRDCSPWNIILSDVGAPGLVDWESAEPRGLPALDLVYFLTTGAFVLEGALETGLTRQTYATMLDAGTATGRVAADCLAEYCRALDLDPAALPAFRLLTWIIHSRSDFRHIEIDTGAEPTHGSLRSSVFLGLVQEELSRDPRRSVTVCNPSA
jgi:hypothetical protein